MATMNPFDLLGDDDNDDPSQLLAAQEQKAPPSAPAASKKGSAQPQPAKPAASAKMPSKPLPPSEAVREGKSEYQRGGGRGGPRGGGHGRGGGGGRGRGFNQEYIDTEDAFGSNNNNGFSGGYRPSEEGEGGRTFERRGGYGGGGPRGGFRGGRRGGFSNGEAADGEERPRRVYERRSGTGRGNDLKREGAGRANWGTPSDDIAPDTEEPINEVEKTVDTEKQTSQEDTGDATKDSPSNETEVKEPEEKEMTLEEYEKVLEEKRKALLASKPEERKVCLDKELESMQLLSNKKNDNEVFVKLGSDKEKKKEAAEKVKKTKSINEFLKPAEGENYRSGGRGRGRGRGRGGYGGNFSNVDALSSTTPSIEDVGQFPTLGSK